MRSRLALALCLALVLAACQSSASPSASDSGGAPVPGASSAESVSGSGEPAGSQGSGQLDPTATPAPGGGGGGGGGSSGVNCSSGSLTPDLSGSVSQTNATAHFSQGFCVVAWNLSFPSKGATGTARVLAGNDVMLAIDMANYFELGSEAGQFWQRRLPANPPVGVVPGSTVRLDLSGCSLCEYLEVTFEAASR